MFYRDYGFTLKFSVQFKIQRRQVESITPTAIILLLYLNILEAELLKHERNQLSCFVMIKQTFRWESQSVLSQQE